MMISDDCWRPTLCNNTCQRWLCCQHVTTTMVQVRFCLLHFASAEKPSPPPLPLPRRNLMCCWKLYHLIGLIVSRSFQVSHPVPPLFVAIIRLITLPIPLSLFLFTTDVHIIAVYNYFGHLLSQKSFSFWLLILAHFNPANFPQKCPPTLTTNATSLFHTTIHIRDGHTFTHCWNFSILLSSNHTWTKNQFPPQYLPPIP